jgi:hypothetical protein
VGLWRNGREMYLARYIFFLDALLGRKRTPPFQKWSCASVPNTAKFSETEGPLLTDETVRFLGFQTRPKREVECICIPSLVARLGAKVTRNLKIAPLYRRPTKTKKKKKISIEQDRNAL